MIKLIPILSQEAPLQRNALWIKPVSGGFALYLMEGGKWLPQKQVGEDSSSDLVKTALQELVGKSQDSISVNTICGVKNYTESRVKTLKGSVHDTSKDLTLYGLKAYIDEKLADIL